MNKERSAAPMTDADYRAIEAFRATLRRFLHFSEEAARAAGISPQQHQVLLAIRGFPGEGAPTVGDLAEALQIRHNSCVGLIDRLEAAELVHRESTEQDARKVLVQLTVHGEETLASLTSAHRREHRQFGSVLDALLRIQDTPQPDNDESGVDAA